MTQKRKPTVEPESPNTQAGAPPRQDQNKISLETADRTGRPRDEGSDVVQRSGPQSARPEPPGLVPSDVDADDRETL
jgi:hypothetical protein